MRDSGYTFSQETGSLLVTDNSMSGSASRYLNKSFVTRTRMKQVSKKSLEDGTTIEDIEIPLHIGIATGPLFYAIQGDEESSSNRVDITVIGQTKLRARNLLKVASTAFGKVYIDYATMSQARSEIDSEYVKHVYQPPHLFNVPIFEPIPEEPLDAILQNTHEGQNVNLAFK